MSVSILLIQFFKKLWMRNLLGVASSFYCFSWNGFPTSCRLVVALRRSPIHFHMPKLQLLQKFKHLANLLLKRTAMMTNFFCQSKTAFELDMIVVFDYLLWFRKIAKQTNDERRHVISVL